MGPALAEELARRCPALLSHAPLFLFHLTRLLLMSAAIMIPLLTASGLAGFWLFYKSIHFFDNI